MTDYHSTKGPDSIKFIFDILQGPVQMAVLESAIEMGISDILQETSDIQKIASVLKVETDTVNLGYFLDSMVSLGFASKKEGAYFNTGFAEAFLCTRSPTYMGDLVVNMKKMQHKNLGRISHIIKKGPPEVTHEEALTSEVKWKNAVRHLASYQRAGIASCVADIIESLPEFKTASRIMDLGCGPGIMCMEVVKRHPDLHGVLVDLPGIIKLAQEEIEKENLGLRMSCISGDYNETDLGSGYDIIWASHNLYYVKKPVSFFKRVLESMNDNGVFISLHEGLTCERTAPSHVVLSRLSLALEGQDVSFEKGEIANHLLAAGFNSVETTPLILPMGETELVVARKIKK